jgi:hypothetical protein
MPETPYARLLSFKHSKPRIASLAADPMWNQSHR